MGIRGLTFKANLFVNNWTLTSMSMHWYPTYIPGEILLPLPSMGLDWALNNYMW